MEKEISIKYLLQILKKYLAIILIVAVFVAAAAGALAALTTKPTYSSSAKVLIKYSYGDNILTPSGQMNELNYTLAILPTIIETLESYDFLDTVNDKAGLNYSHSSMKSFITYDYASDSKILNITVKTPNKADTKKICDAFTAVVPAYAEELNFGYFDFFENFRTPSKSSVDIINICLIAFLGAFAVMYMIFFMVSEINNKRVNENTDLPNRYQLPVIGKIPDFNANRSQKNKKEGGYYEEAKY